MKNEELKTLWKLAKTLWIGATILWLVETIIFLIIEGWHYKATHPIEIYLDKVVSSMWNFALWLTVVTCFYFLSNLNKSK